MIRNAPSGRDSGIKPKFAYQCRMLGQVIIAWFAVRVREQTYSRFEKLFECFPAASDFAPSLGKIGTRQNWVGNCVGANLHSA